MYAREIRMSGRSVRIGDILDRFNNLRECSWSDEEQSRFVESILVRIYVPSFYVDETDVDNWIIVDGLKRLTAIIRFVSGELKLCGLEYMPELLGTTYNDLSLMLQRRITETLIVLNSIEYGTSDDAKANIIRRIRKQGGNSA